MFEDVIFVVSDYLVWLRRRTYLGLFGLMALFFIPIILAKAAVDFIRGRGWFADPRGKPSLLTYASNLIEFVMCTMCVRTKPALDEALEAAKNAPVQGSGDGVTVRMTDDYIEFQPPGDSSVTKKDVGAIIFQGALVSPFAYSVLARNLARKGYPCFVLRLPFNMAFYEWSTAGKVMKRQRRQGAPAAPAKWVLVGHSLGITGIQKFVEARPECVDGMIYMGGGSTFADLSHSTTPCLVIRGSRDPFTQEEFIQASSAKWPQGTETFVVEGGNHRGFASYAHQPMDWEATISSAEQIRITLDAITEFVERRVT